MATPFGLADRPGTATDGRDRPHDPEKDPHGDTTSDQDFRCGTALLGASA
jgi:hypothetical protein